MSILTSTNSGKIMYVKQDMAQFMVDCTRKMYLTSPEYMWFGSCKFNVVLVIRDPVDDSRVYNYSTEIGVYYNSTHTADTTAERLIKTFDSFSLSTRIGQFKGCEIDWQATYDLLRKKYEIPDI